MMIVISASVGRAMAAGVRGKLAAVGSSMVEVVVELSMLDASMADIREGFG